MSKKKNKKMRVAIPDEVQEMIQRINNIQKHSPYLMFYLGELIKPEKPKCYISAFAVRLHLHAERLGSVERRKAGARRGQLMRHKGTI